MKGENEMDIIPTFQFLMCEPLIDLLREEEKEAEITGLYFDGKITYEEWAKRIYGTSFNDEGSK